MAEKGVRIDQSGPSVSCEKMAPNVYLFILVARGLRARLAEHDAFPFSADPT